MINGTIVYSNLARSHFLILEELKEYQQNAGKKIDGCDGFFLTSEVRNVGGVWQGTPGYS